MHTSRLSFVCCLMEISRLILVCYLMSNCYLTHFGFGTVAGLIVVMMDFFYGIVIVEVGIGFNDFDC